MADDDKRNQQSGDEPSKEKRAASGDNSGQGRPRRDDHVLPPEGGRNEFGTHGGPNGEGDLRGVERKDSEG